MSDPLPLIVANLKSNKTWDELAYWLDAIGPQTNSFTGTVVVCPSMAFISEASQKVKEAGWKLKVGAQNISQFEAGAYTGEVAATQIGDQAGFAIIGHSERRRYFGETDEIVAQKLNLAQSAGLRAIFCVQDENTPIPVGAKIIAYEPVAAIGTGKPDSPENAKEISAKIKQKGDYIVMYGGSADAQNIKSFLESGLIDGALIATASLQSDSFSEILKSTI
jgi:triosephosphate isomerase